MSIAEWAIRHRIAVLMGVLAVFVLGIIAFLNLNVDLMPDISYPSVTIMTVYPGASPYEVEDYVTRKIEDAVLLCDNVEDVNSISMEGYSIVTVEFKWGTNMDFAQFDVRQKIDQIRDLLPDDAHEPMIMHISLSSFMPIAFLSLSGQVDEGYLRWLGDEVIAKQLEQIDGVARVSVLGGLEREIHVVPDPLKMSQYRVSLMDIFNAIRFNNLSYPAGHFTFGTKDYRLRTYSEVRSLEDINLMPVKVFEGKVVRIGDVAKVIDTHKERQSYVLVDEKPAVFFMVYKESEKNTVKVCDRLRRAVPRIAESVPPGLTFRMVMGFDERIKAIINNLKHEAIEGGLLAMLIVFLFLVSFRSTLIVGLSLPISVVATFVALYFLGASFNVVTVGGLALALGRIVDDSIVVIESITRHLKQEPDPFKAVVDGTMEVWLAIAATTFTTISVFVPILFVKGLVREFFKGFSTVMIVGLLTSLLVAAMVIPPLAYKAALVHKNIEDKPRENIITRIVKYLQEIYGGILRTALKFKYVTILLGFLILIGSIFSIRIVGVDFLPNIAAPIVMAYIFTPPGTTLDTTFDKVKQVGSIMRSEVSKLAPIEISAEAAGADEHMMLMLASFGITASSEYGEVEVKFDSRYRMKRDLMVENIRQRLKDIPDITYNLINPLKMLSGSVTRPIEVEFKGPDLDTLWKLANELRAEMREIPGVTDIDLSWKRGAPEIRVELDRKRAAVYGVTAMDIAYLLQVMTSGKCVTKYKIKGYEYDIRIKMDKPTDENVLKDFPIVTMSGQVIPLSSVANIKISRAPTMITRNDRIRTIKVLANKTPDRSLSELLKEIERRIDKIGLPVGYTYAFKGEEKQRRETFAGVLAALVLGIFLMYAILAVQFNSLTHPLVIMFSIPFELIGVILGLLVFRQTLNLMSMMGILMVTGIVVSNAVLLVDYANQLRARGMDKDSALEQAGKVRLKPILMTTLATVFSMFPLALGLREGGELFRPLAAAVMGGLTTSTLLTLLVVPAVYSIIEDIIPSKFSESK